MISSVLRPTVAVPCSLAKRLGGLAVRARLPALLSSPRPSSATSKVTPLPGMMPRRSRTSLGMVTCPLVVTVVALQRSDNT